MGWMDQAACQDHDTDDFFPDGVTPQAQRQAAAAKQVCSGCPVQVRCLTWALDTGANYGVWGGLTERERRSFERREAQRRAHEPSKARRQRTAL